MSKGGPATGPGRASSSRNAIRHAVLATMPVVPGMESEEDWEAHRAGILESLAPEGALETLLAERVALQSWRLQRVARYETGAIASAQERVVDDVDPPWRRRSPALPAPDEDAVTLAQEASQFRDRILILQQFAAMSDDAPLCGEDADTIVGSAEATLENATREDAHVSFMADGLCVDEFPEWTAGKLRELLISMAAVEGTNLDALLTAALECDQAELSRLEAETEAEAARLEAERARLEAEEEAERVALAAKIVRAHRERLLPAHPVMEKVARYEAHLSREFYKALHELEAMQERRAGRAAPLARLEVSGLPER